MRGERSTENAPVRRHPLKPFEPVARQGVRNGATFLEDLEEGHQGRRQRGIERRWGLSWTVDVAGS